METEKTAAETLEHIAKSRLIRSLREIAGYEVAQWASDQFLAGHTAGNVTDRLRRAMDAAGSD